MRNKKAKETRMTLRKAEAPIVILAAGEEIPKMTKTLYMMTGRRIKLERTVNNQMRRRSKEQSRKSQKAVALMLTWVTTIETQKITKAQIMTTGPLMMVEKIVINLTTISLKVEMRKGRKMG